MANKSSKRRARALREACKHFHGKACNTAKKDRKPRDESRKLRGMNEKRTLDKRIRGWLTVYA